MLFTAICLILKNNYICASKPPHTMPLLKKLRFFVKKPQYPKTYFRIKGGYEPPNRDMLSFHYEHKPIVLNEVRFQPQHVYAEARKKNVWAEVLIFATLPILVLYFFGTDIPQQKYLVALAMGIIFGVLVGLLRIIRQKLAANKFNRS